ncbi:molybdenum cofactor guanylyltransferase MobA [Aestuariivirga sp.]|uniref:molybdenum cofactor guanylyltransferase MobA n=1 Tax=Aestuariivirga sp. TaxID=2650926 RepID=UPI0025BB1195|nr:molybdenum cofactor guanylyltransferase MobA [Aestuariivirga sp.]MCA3554288.1 molybdenum cofactor guanylyltransferase [Aestuariivirga sp.]
MKLCAVIVAGGRSSRMGREKAFALIRGRSILERVTACLAPQVPAIVLNANRGTERFCGLGHSVVADIRTDIATPLAGVHAALAYGKETGCDAVLTVPCDAPFLPADLAARLVAAGRPAAIAATSAQQHYLTGLWSTALLSSLASAMDKPLVPRLQDWQRMCDAAVVEWPVDPYDPFFNVNTPEDLAEAGRIAAEFNL